LCPFGRWVLARGYRCECGRHIELDAVDQQILAHLEETP
jgi:hypothetical protein